VQLRDIALGLQQPTSALMDEVEDKTGFVPPGRRVALTVGELKLRLPPVETAPQFAATWESGWAGLLAGRLDDKTILLLYPARLKSDLAIRRLRFRDCFLYHRRVFGRAKTLRWLEIWRAFDYITVSNFLCANCLIPVPGGWAEWWYDLGAFGGGLSHFTNTAKTVNNFAKSRGIEGVDRMLIAENQVLSGYRQPPYEGFDPVAEAEALAHGGRAHGLRNDPDPLGTFTRLAEAELVVGAETIDYEEFTQWVESGAWSTSGASSVGEVLWQADTPDGPEQGKLKARKNLVPDVADLHALAMSALAQRAQVNKAFVKPEQGKLRTAVTSDTETYLKMEWATRSLGTSYLRWRGSTLNERSAAERRRLYRMWMEIISGWDLPFDYLAEDHQPTTAELQAIVDCLYKQALKNAHHSLWTSEQVAQLTAIFTNIRGGFDDSMLYVRDPATGKVIGFRVHGGVMSGLRWTTLLDNAWNLVMTAWAEEVLERCGINIRSHSWIRGDDNAVVTGNFWAALLMKLAYDAIGVEAGEGKFGIHNGESEFLRVWYSSRGLAGYISRAVPGLMQRKPWNPEPWHPDGVITAVFDSFRTLRRRGAANVDLLRDTVVSGWARRTGLDARNLQWPRAYGGLGLETYRGWATDSAMRRKPTTTSIRVTNATGWRAQQVILTAARAGITISQTVANAVADNDRASILAGDDIPAVNSALRAGVAVIPDQRWIRDDLAWTVPQVEEVLTEVRRLTTLAADAPTAQQPRPDKNDYMAWSLFIQCSKLVRAGWTPPGARGALDFVGLRWPAFAQRVRSLERRGFRRAEAVDWVGAPGGGVPLGPLQILHPALTGEVAHLVGRLVSSWLTRRRFPPSRLQCYVAQVTTLAERALTQSRLARALYSW